VAHTPESRPPVLTLSPRPVTVRLHYANAGPNGDQHLVPGSDRPALLINDGAWHGRIVFGEPPEWHKVQVPEGEAGLPMLTVWDGEESMFPIQFNYRRTLADGDNLRMEASEVPWSLNTV
jgi:hypothetical protein